MNKLRRWLSDMYVPVLLGVIVISVGGSLVLLAYQSARINEQIKSAESQLKEIKGINVSLENQSRERAKDIQRIIQENQKQTAYLECLLAIDGVFTDQQKNDCQRQAEVSQQSPQPSPNSSPTPTSKPLPAPSQPSSQPNNPRPAPQTPQPAPTPPAEPQPSLIESFLDAASEVITTPLRGGL